MVAQTEGFTLRDGQYDQGMTQLAELQDLGVLCDVTSWSLEMVIKLPLTIKCLAKKSNENLCPLFTIHDLNNRTIYKFVNLKFVDE